MAVGLEGLIGLVGTAREAGALGRRSDSCILHLTRRMGIAWSPMRRMAV